MDNRQSIASSQPPAASRQQSIANSQSPTVSRPQPATSCLSPPAIRHQPPQTRRPSPDARYPAVGDQQSAVVRPPGVGPQSCGHQEFGPAARPALNRRGFGAPHGRSDCPTCRANKTRQVEPVTPISRDKHSGGGKPQRQRRSPSSAPAPTSPPTASWSLSTTRRQSPYHRPHDPRTEPRHQNQDAPDHYASTTQPASAHRRKPRDTNHPRHRPTP